MACDESIALRERLEELPRELYDWIYRMTFSAECQFVKISKPRRSEQKDSRRPSPFPNLLHVSRSTRAMYASAYYAKSVFILDDTRLGIDWLRFIPDEHMKHMQDVRCLWPGSTGSSPPGSIDVNLGTNAALLRPTNDIVLELRRLSNGFQARTLYEFGPPGVITMFVSGEAVCPLASHDSYPGFVNDLEQISSWPLVPRSWCQS